MKDLISGLNKAFESRIRLGIMSVLMVNETIDFNTLKDMLNVSDGNLASHISALEKISYIKVTKQFIGKKTNTSYAVSPIGKKAFQEHLDALEKLIKGND
ncbi:MAG: transcriptional regulator [Chitinophagales bacterium]|nr:transcriptional regulator [Chitinophagales bacterium]